MESIISCFDNYYTVTSDIIITSCDRYSRVIDMHLVVLIFSLELNDFAKNVFKLESEDQHKKRMALLNKREDDLSRHKQRKEKREKVR